MLNKNLNQVLIIVLALFVSSFASCAKKSYKRYARDVKLPTQYVIEVDTIEDCAATDTDYVLTANAGDSTGVATTVSTMTAQPDVPRVLTVTPGGTTTDVKAGNVVITGTNINNEVVTDTLAFLDNASTATTGTVAFKSVTSIVFPAEDSPYGATWTVGITDKLGLSKAMAGNDVILVTSDGTYETTRPTVAYDVDEVEKNTVDPDTACNAAKDFRILYIQNYGD